jgi:hypothetical protein
VHPLREFDGEHVEVRGARRLNFYSMLSGRPTPHQPSNRHAAVFYKPRPAVLLGQGAAVAVDDALLEHNHRATEHYHHEHVQSHPAQCL